MRGAARASPRCISSCHCGALLWGECSVGAGATVCSGFTFQSDLPTVNNVKIISGETHPIY